MSENQIAPVGELGSNGLGWFARCLLIALVVGLGINAASYFFLTPSIVDLIGANNKASEAIGFPEVFWRDYAPRPPSNTYAVSVPYPGNGSIDYASLGWNLMLVLVPGGMLGGFAAKYCHRLNASTVHQRQRRLNSRLARGHFQITTRGILSITAIVAATIAVWSQFGSIERKPVESSNIVSIGYNSFTKTLEVEFWSGSIYQYFDVPPKVYQELLSADSHGGYLSKNIRRKFVYDTPDGKKPSIVLLVILILGPIYLFTFAILLNRLSRETKIILATMLGALMICVSMSTLVRVDMNPDRVLMGFFIFWMPQIALFVLLQTIVFALQSAFFKPVAHDV